MNENDSDGVDILWWIRMPWIWGDPPTPPWGSGET